MVTFKRGAHVATQTIVATALPTIVGELGGGSGYSWVGRRVDLERPSEVSLILFQFLFARCSNIIAPLWQAVGSHRYVGVHSAVLRSTAFAGRKPVLFTSIIVFLVCSPPFNYVHVSHRNQSSDQPCREQPKT
jgi:hypothetical protein